MTIETKDVVAELLSLAERCEQETGPDRDLDAAIMDALHIGEYRTKNGLLGYPLEPKPYTVSLDAAMTLVPGGMAWVIGVDVAGVHFANVDFGTRHDGATPALALCAAALKARAQNTPDSERGE